MNEQAIRQAIANASRSASVSAFGGAVMAYMCPDPNGWKPAPNPQIPQLPPITGPFIQIVPPTRAQVFAWMRQYLAAERELDTARRLSTPEALACIHDEGTPGQPSVEARRQERRDRYQAALIAWGAIQWEADGGMV